MRRVSQRKRKAKPLMGNDSLAPETRKLDRRVLKTRKALFAAFDRLVRTKDYDKITISELAREADIDRKTFYLHYASIDAMLDDRVDAIVGKILDAVECDMRSRVAKNRENSAGIEPDLQIFFSVVSKAVKAYVPMREHIFAAMPAGVLANRLARPMAKEIRRRGLARIDADPDTVGICMSSLVGAIIGIYSAWIEGGLAVSEEKVSAVASRMIGAALREFSA